MFRLMALGLALAAEAAGALCKVGEHQTPTTEKGNNEQDLNTEGEKMSDGTTFESAHGNLLKKIEDKLWEQAIADLAKDNKLGDPDAVRQKAFEISEKLRKLGR